MAEFTKYIIIAIIGCVCSSVLKKGNPELKLALELAVVISLLAAFFGMMNAVKGYISELINEFQLPSDLIYNMLKVCGCTVITKIISEICRDSGENAIAACVELIGTVSAIIIVMPSLLSFINTLNSRF